MCQYSSYGKAYETQKTFSMYCTTSVLYSVVGPTYIHHTQKHQQVGPTVPWYQVPGIIPGIRRSIDRSIVR